MSIEDVSLKIRNYKCFGEEAQGYNYIKPVNLVIGRNNSGKSTLLDLVHYATEQRDLSTLAHRGGTPAVLLTTRTEATEVQRVFSSSITGGIIPGNHWNYGMKWIGAQITIILQSSGQLSFEAIDPPFDREIGKYADSLASAKGNPFTNYSFKRLLADRDIAPEVDQPDPSIAPNGNGFTNTVQQFINKASLPSDLVEIVLLRELNSIFEPDATFSRIVVQQLGTGAWEVYLEEVDKGRVPLSHSGSGLKTILLVLSTIHLVPVIENRPLKRYLFGFEELENNLHPALQRRLLLYLRKVALKDGCHFFLTTHSSVAIDLFANDEKAQILHVTHDRKSGVVKPVTTYVENRGILDDLDVRASDLLQSNGIIWVEGPSDRLYFNRWIELWTDGALQEGAHYQCVFYGGRLLAHLSATDPDLDPEDAVKILRVNRNALLLIDSDKRYQSHPVNSTKKRVVSEIDSIGGVAWVTAGREVENYLPAQALNLLYGRTDLRALERYEDFADYLESLGKDEGKRFLRNKVLFAEKIAPHLTLEQLRLSLDLAGRLALAVGAIQRWNGLSVTTTPGSQSSI